MNTSAYGQVAITATDFFRTKSVNSPENAWEKAVKKIFPDSVSSQEKGCPKSAYLGLCEEGLVRGVPAGNYTRSECNKSYAVCAVTILAHRPELKADADFLWEVVLNMLKKGQKTPNKQMDVVIALWRNGDITPPTN